jgi:hypothetical protein
MKQMNDHDEFLSQFRKAPRREFAEGLYSELAEQRKQPMFAKLNPFVRRIAPALAALVLVFVATVALSPAARARALEWWERTIGGVTIIEVPADQQTPPVSEDEVTIVPSESVTLEEARQILPFKQPTWLPEGFTAYDGRYDAAINLTRWPLDNGGTMTMIDLRWESFNNGYPTIIMLRVDDYPAGGQIVGDNSGAREVTFNGLTGAIFKGAWNADTGRFEGSDLSLMWIDGDLKYLLMGNRGAGVSEQDLINIAASME